MPNRKLTLEEHREYCVRANKNLGEWDYDLLADFDLDKLKEIGFDNDDLDKIMNFSPDEKDDEVPEVPEEPKSNLGEIYQLGNHRIMCGDSTNQGDVEKLIDNKTAKLIFTSPPYNMASDMYENYEDNLKSEEYIKFNIITIELFKKYLKGFIFWNISYNKNTRWEFIEIFYRIIKETGLKFLELIVWNKKHGTPITSKELITRQYEDILLVGDDDNIQQDLELFYVGRNDKRAYFNKKNQKGITNYWEIGTNKTQLDNHLACYPVALPIKGILLMTQINDIVIDPFLGSGSTLIACEKTDRICYGMEIDPKYIDVIIERWEKYTEKKVVKIN